LCFGKNGPQTSVFVTPTIQTTPSTTAKARRNRPARAASASLAERTIATYDAAAMILRFGEPAEDRSIAAARATFYPRVPVGEGARTAMNEIRARLDDASAAKMRDYEPELPPEYVKVIRAFVEDSVALALPLTSYSVETLLRPVMHFVYWAVFVVGCDLDALVVFDRELIQNYVPEALPANLAAGTKRNYRAWITRVAEVVNPDKNPRNSTPLNQKDMEAPYSEDEIVALDRWAAGQATAYKRQGAAVLIALGAGAGLSAVEIANLRRESVTVHDDGTVEIQVLVKDEWKRRVIVTAEFEQIIATAVEGLSGNSMVFLWKRNRTENDVVSAFVGKCAKPRGTPTVQGRRLRNTWFVSQMTNRVDVLTLMEAAGLQSIESISRLAKFVPRLSTDDRDAQLRGAL
jgi:integrase